MVLLHRPKLQAPQDVGTYGTQDFTTTFGKLFCVEKNEQEIRYLLFQKNSRHHLRRKLTDFYRSWRQHRKQNRLLAVTNFLYLNQFYNINLKVAVKIARYAQNGRISRFLGTLPDSICLHKLLVQRLGGAEFGCQQCTDASLLQYTRHSVLPTLCML